MSMGVRRGMGACGGIQGGGSSTAQVEVSAVGLAADSVLVILEGLLPRRLARTQPRQLLLYPCYPSDAVVERARPLMMHVIRAGEADEPMTVCECAAGAHPREGASCAPGCRSVKGLAAKTRQGFYAQDEIASLPSAILVQVAKAGAKGTARPCQRGYWCVRWRGPGLRAAGRVQAACVGDMRVVPIQFELNRADTDFKTRGRKGGGRRRGRGEESFVSLPLAGRWRPPSAF